MRSKTSVLVALAAFAMPAFAQNNAPVDTDLEDTVRLSGDRATALMATLPHLFFDAPVPTKEMP